MSVSKLQNKDFPQAELALTIQTNSGITTLYADSTKNTIGKYFFSFVINNGIYAKNTGRDYNGYQTKNADLRIRDIIVIHQIPEKNEMKYNISELKRKLQYSDLKSIKTGFENIYNLQLLSKNIEFIKQAATQKSPTLVLHNFITSQKEEKDINKLKENSKIAAIFQLIDSSEFTKLTPSVPTWQIVVQLLCLYSTNDFKKIYQYCYYKNIRQKLNKQLADFNTTKREIVTKEKKGQLILSFPSANSLSNGERDILYFLAKITAFQYNTLQQKASLLIIDEIFDYLDGGNLLAAQYYLSQLIKKMKEEQKVCFCAIFTHLDPTLFNSCYIKNPKFIYLSNCQIKQPNSKIINLVLLRENEKHLKDPIAQYFLHYTPKKIPPQLEQEIAKKTQICSWQQFFREIKEELIKYIKQEQYDTLSVICAVRYFAEKNIFEQLSEETDKQEFLATHKTLDKFRLFENKINIDEKFYFLAPLYNDSLHLNDSNKNQKINLSSIKLSSKIIHQIITELFSNL